MSSFVLVGLRVEIRVDLPDPILQIQARTHACLYIYIYTSFSCAVDMDESGGAQASPSMETIHHSVRMRNISNSCV